MRKTNTDFELTKISRIENLKWIKKRVTTPHKIYAYI